MKIKEKLVSLKNMLTIMPYWQTCKNLSNWNLSQNADYAGTPFPQNIRTNFKKIEEFYAAEGWSYNTYPLSI